MKAFKRRAHGELDWMMHDFQKMYSITWKDKQLVLLLSTHLLMEILRLVRFLEEMVQIDPLFPSLMYYLSI